MTQTLHRVRLTATGWDSALMYESTPIEDSPLEDHFVEINVDACGVCFRDLIDREGRFPFLQLPITPGHEVAGRVRRVGARVRDFRIGDRVGTMHRDACGECRACRTGNTSLCPASAFVFGIMADGGYASRLRAPESALFPIPKEMRAAEAAILHCTFGTAFRSLRAAGLAARERVLITGANGGVGSAAVQVAQRFGADVTAVVRTPGHEDFLHRLGVERIVISPDARFHKEVGDFDVVIENVGTPTFNASLRSLGIGGRLVVVGNVDPGRVELNLGFIVVNALKILGVGGATREDMAALLAEHAKKPFHIPIARELPLSDAETAQRSLRQGGVQGRLVLIPPHGVNDV